MPSSREKLWRALSWPNRISLMRLVLIWPFLVLLTNQNQPGWPWARYAAIGMFLLMAVSDWLDGMLARRLDVKTRLGAILDPLADKTLIVSTVILLSMPSFSVPGAQIANWVVIAIVGKDLWVIVGFVVVYMATDRVRVQPTLAGKASTVGQLVMLAGVLLAPDMNRLGDRMGSLFAFYAGVAAAALSVCAAVSYTRLGLRFVLSNEKPLDEPTTGRGENHAGHGTNK